MEVNEKIFLAMQDFKGLDHLVHFSLKYTRTTSVLKTVLEKIRNIEENLINALYIYAKQEDPTLKNENVIVLRSKIVCKYFDDEKINENHEFYLKVKKLIRHDCDGCGDFRKHVALTYNFDDKEYIFDLKQASEFYIIVKKNFLYLLKKMDIKPFQIDFEDFTI